MSTQTYLCGNCGALRRAPVVYKPNPRQTWDEIKVSAVWPKHGCQPMQSLTFVQGVAATHIESNQRIVWASSGLHILKWGGKKKWIPALKPRQIVWAKQQTASFLLHAADRQTLKRGKAPL